MTFDIWYGENEVRTHKFRHSSIGKKIDLLSSRFQTSVAANLKVSSSQVQDGVASKSQNGLQGTAARRSSFWRCSTANPPQRNAARRILEWIWICSASASPESGMHQNALKWEEISLPMQWGQVVEYTGHPHRARARMCGDLGNLGSAFQRPWKSWGKINHHILSA